MGRRGDWQPRATDMAELAPGQPRDALAAALLGLAIIGALMAGAGGFVIALLAIVNDSSYVAATLAVIGSGLAFGLVATAIAKR